MRHADDAELELQLQTLRERVVQMGQTAEEMLARGLHAFSRRDSDQARRTIDTDDIIDDLEKESDGLGLRILAGWHPADADLRFVTTALKIVTELERVGDMTVNLCRKTLELNDGPPCSRCFDIQRMGEAALRMVHQAVVALQSGDAESARAVIEEDDVLDRYYLQMNREIVECMMEEPQTIPAASCIQVIAKDVERIGDHATNVAELVVFMVQGDDIRHVWRGR
jgi:phosphate transport system protein